MAIDSALNWSNDSNSRGGQYELPTQLPYHAFFLVKCIFSAQ